MLPDHPDFIPDYDSPQVSPRPGYLYRTRGGSIQGPLSYRPEKNPVCPWSEPRFDFEGKAHLAWRGDGGFKAYPHLGKSILDLVEELPILH